MLHLSTSTVLVIKTSPWKHKPAAGRGYDWVVREFVENTCWKDHTRVYIFMTVPTILQLVSGTQPLVSSLYVPRPVGPGIHRDSCFVLPPSAGTSRLEIQRDAVLGWWVSCREPEMCWTSTPYRDQISMAVGATGRSRTAPVLTLSVLNRYKAPERECSYGMLRTSLEILTPQGPSTCPIH